MQHCKASILQLKKKSGKKGYDGKCYVMCFLQNSNLKQPKIYKNVKEKDNATIQVYSHVRKYNSQSSRQK